MTAPIRPIDWDLIAPPRPVISEAALRAEEERHANESNDQYLRRLWQEQS